MFVASCTYELPVGKGRHFMNHSRVLDYLIGGYELAWIQTFEYRQSVRLQLHQQPVQLLPDQHREPCSQPDLQRHFDAAVRAGQPDRRQPVQPGAGESGAAGELLRGARRRSRPAMPDATSSPARASCTRRPRPRRTSPSRNGWNLQLRFDFQNPFHNWGFNTPSNQVDFKNPQLFGKITGDQTTASFAGEPLMNLMLRLSW